MTAEIKIVVAGSSGRMGQVLLTAIAQTPGCVLHGALVRPGSPDKGRSVAVYGGVGDLLMSDDMAATLSGADVLIDFTRPAATMQHLAICRRAGIKMVIGTTGFDAEQKQLIIDAGKETGIVFAPNMSVGVNLTFKLLEMAAKILNRGYDIEIIEAHHRHKADAPSGTALRMGEVVAGALGRELSECAVYGREGITGERDPSTIGFATVRGGDIVGDHTVLFAGIGERVEITHKATSRMTFAQGALRAAQFLVNSGSGCFDMEDVLGLRN
ncbi:MAG: 4-hydroxy-tetrahydrodipicolinate reductase [Sulfuriferula sp.]